MKTICLISGLLMTSLLIHAQNNGNKAVVAAAKMNILYRGIENPIEVAVPGVPSEKVSVIVTNGTLNKTASGYSVSPGEQAESVIKVLVAGKEISEKKFRIKNIPQPVALFAGKNEGEIDREVALKTDSLEAELKNFLWDLTFEIKGFTFLCSKDNSDLEEVSVGNKLTDKMKSLISEIKPGKMIVFKDIKAKGPDGKIKDLNQIILKIK
jgi:gliding motility-associated protein GldM